MEDVVWKTTWWGGGSTDISQEENNLDKPAFLARLEVWCVTPSLILISTHLQYKYTC
jgi:hypothetical protein